MSEIEAALWTPPDSSGARGPEALEMLRAVPLFDELKRSELKKVLRILHERTYQPDEVVFREGEPGAGMYLVRRGEVDIVIQLEGGAEQVIATLGERQFFGEMALLEDEPRSAGCVATKRTELLGFFQPDLEDLLDRDPKLGSKVLWNLARLMASRLRTMNRAIRAPRLATPAQESR